MNVAMDITDQQLQSKREESQSRTDKRKVLFVQHFLFSPAAESKNKLSVRGGSQ